MVLDPAIWSVIAAVVGVIGSIVVARYTKKSQDDANQTSKWEAMFNANEAQMQRLSNEVAESNEKVDRLEEKVDKLERDLQHKDKQLYWSLTYVRELIRHIVGNDPSAKYPAAPDQIEDLI